MHKPIDMTDIFPLPEGERVGVRGGEPIETA
jgi:hypothetical protein